MIAEMKLYYTFISHCRAVVPAPLPRPMLTLEQDEPSESKIICCP